MMPYVGWTLVCTVAVAAVTGCGAPEGARAPGASRGRIDPPPGLAVTSAGPRTDHDHVQLIGNRIYGPTGVQIVARGPEAVIANRSQTGDVEKAASFGANAMRMLLTLDAANGMTPADFDAVIGTAVAHDMLVWVSLYTWDNARGNVIGQALGGGNFYSLAAPPGTGTCSIETPGPCYLAVWQRQWMKDLIAKYKRNVIVDAGQEYVGLADASSAAGRAEWADAAKASVSFFRSQGYSNPLEFLSNFQGRDLYAIVEHGAAIRAVDTVTVNGYPQTMFGWQAYWGTSDGWYPAWQGSLLAGPGQTVSATRAIHEYAATQAFPIQIGIDNYPGDSASEYAAEIDQCAADGMSWLWWSWSSGSGTVECPVDGSTCQSYVTSSPNGFAGARP